MLHSSGCRRHEIRQVVRVAQLRFQVQPRLSAEIELELEGERALRKHDASTEALVQHVLDRQEQD